MELHRSSYERRSPLRTAGRIGIALAAGGAFAALAWDPRPVSETSTGAGDKQNGPYTAERQSIVKEDGASPQFEAATTGRRGEDQWGLTEVKSRKEPRAVGDRPQRTADGVSGGLRSSKGETEEVNTPTTSVVHSRAPP